MIPGCRRAAAIAWAPLLIVPEYANSPAGHGHPAVAQFPAGELKRATMRLAGKVRPTTRAAAWTPTKELRGSLRTVLLRGPLIVSEAELISTGPNGTYPAHVISR